MKYGFTDGAEEASIGEEIKYCEAKILTRSSMLLKMRSLAEKCWRKENLLPGYTEKPKRSRMWLEVPDEFIIKSLMAS